MRPEYRNLRIQQLASTLAAFKEAKSIPRPQRGWLRAIREALGLTLEQVGRSINTGRANVQFFENAEANDKITLQSLRRVANAMGCELVYAIVPKSGTIQNLAETRLRDEATKRVRAVEHTMALENQATGNLEEKIKDEVKRIKAGEK